MRGVSDACIETDVLVCGLGPAGAAAAAEAALRGARVVGIERSPQPGLPVQCAEFVPRMIRAEAAPINASWVQDIDAMETFVAAEAADLTPDFPGYMIDRARFDQALVATAQQAGADCRFGLSLRALHPDGVAELSDGRRFRARVVIGADGPRSAVGSAIHCSNHAFVLTRQVQVDLLQAHRATDIFLHADYVGGYAWLFPKGQRANLGLGVVPSQRAELKPLLQTLHAQLQAQGRVGTVVHASTGGLIPVGGMRGPTGWLNAVAVLLVGDAAGLTHPITGAGISAAVSSGHLAGRAAAAHCQGEATAVDDYAEELHSVFDPSLQRALRRRAELIAAQQQASADAAALRRSWIAYPAYWDDANTDPTPAIAARTPETPCLA